MKGHNNKTKQTVQCKFEGTMLFCGDAKGRFCQLSTNAFDKGGLSAEGATLKLDNQKYGWKGVCIYQEHNGDDNFIPVMALGRQYLSTRQKMSNENTYLSAYWVGVNIKILLWRTRAQRWILQVLH